LKSLASHRGVHATLGACRTGLLSVRGESVVP